MRFAIKPVAIGERVHSRHVPDDTTVEDLLPGEMFLVDLPDWDQPYALASDAISIEVKAVTWGEIRAERDKLLRETDWWALPDSPAMTTPQTDYRQDLRNIPQDFANPEDVVWPTKP